MPDQEISASLVGQKARLSAAVDKVASLSPQVSVTFAGVGRLAVRRRHNGRAGDAAGGRHVRRRWRLAVRRRHNGRAGDAAGGRHVRRRWAARSPSPSRRLRFRLCRRLSRSAALVARSPSPSRHPRFRLCRRPSPSPARVARSPSRSRRLRCRPCRRPSPSLALVARCPSRSPNLPPSLMMFLLFFKLTPVEFSSLVDISSPTTLPVSIDFAGVGGFALRRRHDILAFDSAGGRHLRRRGRLALRRGHDGFAFAPAGRRHLLRNRWDSLRCC